MSPPPTFARIKRVISWGTDGSSCPFLPNFCLIPSMQRLRSQYVMGTTVNHPIPRVRSTPSKVCTRHHHRHHQDSNRYSFVNTTRAILLSIDECQTVSYLPTMIAVLVSCFIPTTLTFEFKKPFQIIEHKGKTCRESWRVLKFVQPKGAFKIAE